MRSRVGRSLPVLRSDGLGRWRFEVFSSARWKDSPSGGGIWQRYAGFELSIHASASMSRQGLAQPSLHFTNR